jgi:capsule biosynthesis phosphatase
MKRLIMDLDETICQTKDGDYSESVPDIDIIQRMREYKDAGFDIVIYTSRNVRTYVGNIGKISAHTLPIIIDWLRKHQVPYDEIYVGKPWCGNEGFYVDDKTIRPSEFLALSRSEITELLNLNK